MAIYRVEHIYHKNSGLPADDVVNTMHFADGDGADAGMAAVIGGHVAACFYDAASLAAEHLESMYSGVISRALLPDIKVYDEDTPGSPLWTGTQLAVRAGTASESLPSEVALCVSYSGYAVNDLPEVAPDDADADSAPERPRSRYRNRMFLGPFAANAGGSRPVASVQQAAVDLVTRLRTQNAEMIAGDCNFVVYSRASNATDLVEKAWCDNEWDTQRRRGDKANARYTVTY